MNWEILKNNQISWFQIKYRNSK